MTAQEFAENYISTGKIMQLATAIDGQPWLCIVNYVSDNNGNLYWISTRNRRHSQEIEQNSRVAAAIVPDNSAKLGIQLTGSAALAPESELDAIEALYAAKFGAKDGRLDRIRKSLPQGPAYYVFKLETGKVYDTVNFPDSPEQYVDTTA